MKKSRLPLLCLFFFNPLFAFTPTDTFTLQCSNGETLKVSYPNQNNAILYYKDKLVLLTSAISASGARYINTDLQWWTKGLNGSLSTLNAGETLSNDTSIECSPAPVSTIDSTANNKTRYRLKFIPFETADK